MAWQFRCVRADAGRGSDNGGPRVTGGVRGALGAPLTRKRHILPHSAQPQHTNDGAPRTRKRHQQEHRPQRPTERSDPTQHAKGRPGDCPGPRKGTTTRRNVRGQLEGSTAGFAGSRTGGWIVPVAGTHLWSVRVPAAHRCCLCPLGVPPMPAPASYDSEVRGEGVPRSLSRVRPNPLARDPDCRPGCWQWRHLIREPKGEWKPNGTEGGVLARLVRPETPVWRHCLSSLQCTAARSRPSDGCSTYTVPVS